MRSDDDRTLPRMYLAGDYELLAPVTRRSVRARESHRAASVDAALAAPDAAALLEAALEKGDGEATQALGSAIQAGLKRAALAKQLDGVGVGAAALRKLLPAPPRADAMTERRARAFAEAVFPEAL